MVGQDLLLGELKGRNFQLSSSPLPSVVTAMIIPKGCTQLINSILSSLAELKVVALSLAIVSR